LFNLLTGFLSPSSGQIVFQGSDITGKQPEQIAHLGIARSFQITSLFDQMSLVEHLELALASPTGLGYRFWRSSAQMRQFRDRAMELLDQVGLADRAGQAAGSLAYGQKRALELALALALDPQLLLLDEPTAGIDPILRQTIWEELGRLRSAGRTLLVTTQYVSEAESCDAVALIAGGRLIALGPPDELRRNAAGGDVIEGETDAPFDPAVLVGKEGIRAARSTGLRQFRVVTDDAGTTTPVLDDLVAAAGGTLTTAREVRLTFDEVFAELVERAASERGEAVQGDAAPATDEDAA